MINTIITKISYEIFSILAYTELLDNIDSNTDNKRAKRLNYLKEYRVKRKKYIKEIKVSVEKKEYEDFKKESSKYNLSVNKFILEQARAYRDNKYLIPNEVKNDLKDLIFLFRNIANNINQIAKQSNIFKTLISSNKLLTNLKELESSVISFINKPRWINNDNKINK